jgi:mRNA interferase RelE/StbE
MATGPSRREIRFTRAAERGLSALPKATQRLIDARILSLADDPHPPGSKKLQGMDGTYRLRVGDYRVLYQVDEGRLVVLIVDVGHRKDVYRP